MSDELVGRQLGKYEIRSEIGRGGMGMVYLGYDPLLDRRVAIKVLAPHLVWEQGFVERFLREARAAARLKHPNIVTIYDVGQEGTSYYFVMEYLEGQTLAEVVKRRGPLPTGEVVAVLRPLADALDDAHRQGLVHRDIKPGNVVVGPVGQVTLTDFGIARAAQEVRLTTTGTLVGTPEYMSPEQARGEEVDHRTDQYSLGVVAYEMLSGRVPFGGTTPHGVLYRQIHEPLPPIRQVRPDLPVGVEAVLQKALAKEPGQRYATVTAFAEAMGQALAGREMAAAAEPPTVLVGAARGVAPAPATPPPSWPSAPPASQAAAGPAPTPPFGAAPAAKVSARRRPSGWVWALTGLTLLVVIALGVALVLLTGGEEKGQVADTATPAVEAYATQPPPPPPTTAPMPARRFECADPRGCVDVAPGQPVRIGYLLATLGDNAPLGIDSKHAVELAIDDRREILGHPLDLIGMDTRCEAGSSVAAAEKLAGDPQLVALVGPSCSNEARAAVPILCEAAISIVSPSSTAPELTGEDLPPDFWCFLRTAPNDMLQGVAAARFAREVLKVDRAATIHDGSLYAEHLQQIFAEKFHEMGGTIATQEGIDPQSGDVRPALARIAETKPQFLYYPVSFDAGVHITRQAREVPGLENIPRMAADAFFSPDFLKAVGDAALGFLWSSPDLSDLGPRYEEFVGKYRERYGEMPISRFHAHAYDATVMILAAIEGVAVRDADGTLHIPRGALNEALYATKGFPGLTGVLSCNRNGDCADPRFAVYECVNTDPASWNPGPGPENNPRKIWP